MILVTFTHICDSCGAARANVHSSDIYLDEATQPPPGWDYGEVGNYLCSDCRAVHET